MQKHPNILIDDGDTDIYFWCKFHFYSRKKSFPTLHQEQVLKWTNELEFFDLIIIQPWSTLFSI